MGLPRRRLAQILQGWHKGNPFLRKTLATFVHQQQKLVHNRPVRSFARTFMAGRTGRSLHTLYREHCKELFIHGACHLWPSVRPSAAALPISRLQSAAPEAEPEDATDSYRTRRRLRVAPARSPSASAGARHTPATALSSRLCFAHKAPSSAVSGAAAAAQRSSGPTFRLDRAAS